MYFDIILRGGVISKLRILADTITFYYNPEDYPAVVMFVRNCGIRESLLHESRAIHANDAIHQIYRLHQQESIVNQHNHIHLHFNQSITPNLLRQVFNLALNYQSQLSLRQQQIADYLARQQNAKKAFMLFRDKMSQKDVVFRMVVSVKERVGNTVLLALASDYVGVDYPPQNLTLPLIAPQNISAILSSFEYEYTMCESLYNQSTVMLRRDIAAYECQGSFICRNEGVISVFTTGRGHQLEYGFIVGLAKSMLVHRGMSPGCAICIITAALSLVSYCSFHSLDAILAPILASTIGLLQEAQYSTPVNATSFFLLLQIMSFLTSTEWLESPITSVSDSACALGMTLFGGYLGEKAAQLIEFHVLDNGGGPPAAA